MISVIRLMISGQAGYPWVLVANAWKPFQNSGGTEVVARSWKAVEGFKRRPASVPGVRPAQRARRRPAKCRRVQRLNNSLDVGRVRR